MLREQIRNARQSESGFTLVELLMVIVILGVLSGIAVFAVSGITDKGEVSACKTDVKTVSVAAEAFYAQNGTYAANQAALVSGGFLHGQATDVTYDGTTTPIVVKGAAGSKCASYTG